MLKNSIQMFFKGNRFERNLQYCTDDSLDMIVPQHFFFCLLTLGHIAHCSRGKDFTVNLKMTQTDIGREFDTILSHSVYLKVGPHGSCTRVFEIRGNELMVFGSVFLRD